MAASLTNYRCEKCFSVYQKSKPEDVCSQCGGKGLDYYRRGDEILKPGFDAAKVAALEEALKAAEQEIKDLKHELANKQSIALGVNHLADIIDELRKEGSKQEAEIEHLKNEHFEMQKSVWASVDVVLQRDQLKLLTEQQAAEIERLKNG